ncbi:MAG: RNase adaptor protein RapZ, partial [Acidobacteria bacterium]|nr:RNase adaptor protein RapZ [Acidobacteriota bacterium]
AVIGTDAMSPHELRRIVQNSLEPGRETSPLHVRVVSFGFKYGLPREADMVFDARFLPNPYFKPELRGKDGRDEVVAEYLEQQAGYREFAERVEGLLEFVMPRFIGEGKSYFTLGIGCTGGRHRSVALAERLASWLRTAGFHATATHRDIDRDAERPR